MTNADKTVTSPFKIIEPTCISFSGGRTSGYMLWRILQEHGGKLPDNAIVCFANTGKEEEATLRFVQDCAVRWDVKIHWLEYTHSEMPSDRFKVVDFTSASRDGTPFFEVIDQNGKPYLPNPIARICTSKLKIKVIHNYLKSIGWDHEESSDWVGIRADEMRRAAKMDRSRTPLVSGNVTKETVGQFWKSQPFDLALPSANGVTMHGNCDLCFLKPAHQVLSLIQEKPERALWWIAMEQHASSSDKSYGAGARFRNDRPSYKEMYEFASKQTNLFDPDEEAISCFCGD